MPTGLHYSSVWGSASDDVWIAGQAGVLAHADGALPWTLTPAPVANDLVMGWSAAQDDVWAVGDGGTILHWDGASWSESPSGTSNDLLFVDGSASDDVWAVGDTTVLHWDGADWTSVPVGVSTTFRGVHALGSDDVWVVGGVGVVRHFDGISWQGVPYPDLASLHTVFAFAPNDVWIGGSALSLRQWNGMAFVQRNGGLPANYTTHRLQGVAVDRIWSTGTQTHPWRREGGNWFSDPSALFEQATWSASHDDVWAAGSSGRIYHRVGGLWQEAWDGPLTLPRSVVDVGGGELWSSDAIVARRTGGVWETNSPPVGSFWYGVWGASPDEVWAVSSSGGVSVWNGAAWNSLPSNAGTNALYAVWGDGEGGVWVGGDGGTLSRYQDFVLTSYNSAGLWQYIWGVGPDDVWALGGSSARHWDGVSWSNVPTPNGSGLAQIHGLAGDDLWAVRGTRVYRWDGASFTDVGYDAVGGVSCVLVRSNTDVLLCGDDVLHHWNGVDWSTHSVNGADLRGFVQTDEALFAYGSNGILRHVP